jgi:hypothetical protein
MGNPLMDDNGGPSPINRVLIALDAPLQDLDLLEMAISLAANRQVELVTLFIEDQDLFHLASLPFAQEIDRVSARERKLDSFQIARTFRAQAQEIGRALERLTKQPRVSHSLKVVRGRYMSEVLSAVTGMEVVFLRKEIGSYKKRFRSLPPEVTTTPVRQSRKHNAVWTIFNGSAGSCRALITASDIARAENRDLVMVLRAPAVELRQQAQTLLKDRAVSVLYTFVPEADDDGLVRLLDNSACGLVVMHRNGTPRSEVLTGLFLRALECPVVLVP